MVRRLVIVVCEEQLERCELDDGTTTDNRGRRMLP